MKIYPTILENDQNIFTQTLNGASQISTTIQIDIADNTLVNNTTIPLAQALSAVCIYPDHLFNIDLMVDDYRTYLTLLNHNPQIESACIRIAPFLKNNIDIHSFSYTVGVAINPDEEIMTYWDIIKQFKFVEIMTIIPGRQGNQFIPETLVKIKDLREHGYTGEIALDGGINETTIYDVLKQKHLPDIAYCGSYLKKNPQKNYNALYSIIESYQKPQY